MLTGMLFAWYELLLACYLYLCHSFLVLFQVINTFYEINLQLETKPLVLSATLLKLEVHTNKAQTFSVYGDANLDKQKD